MRLPLADAYRQGFETHPLVQRICKDPMVDAMLNACAQAAGTLLASKKTKRTTTIGFGAPDSNYYMNPAANSINLDLVKTLAMGISRVWVNGDLQPRAMVEPVVLHELAHALYSHEFPPKMQHLWQRMSEMAPKFGQKVEDGGIVSDPSAQPDTPPTQEERVEYAMLYQEWGALHSLWNALEDHAMNEHAQRLRTRESWRGEAFVPQDRYPIDTARMLQLGYGLFAGGDALLARYHAERNGQQTTQMLPDTAGELASARFSALGNASLYSYYTETLHLLPPDQPGGGKPALRASGIAPGLLDTGIEGAATEDEILAIIRRASRILQDEGLPPLRDEDRMLFVNGEGANGKLSYTDYLQRIRLGANARRNDAIESVFEVAEKIALPELRKQWRQQIEESLQQQENQEQDQGQGQGSGIPDIGQDGATPHASPQAEGKAVPGQGKPAGPAKTVEEGENAQENVPLSDVPASDDKGESEKYDLEAKNAQPLHHGTPKAGKGSASFIGRTALDAMATTPDYSEYSQTEGYKEAVRQIASALETALRAHVVTNPAYARPRLLRTLPGEGISPADIGRYNAGQMHSQATGDPRIGRSFDHKQPVPQPVTHHLAFLVDGTPSMGATVGGSSRQRVGTQMAALMHDAINVVNAQLAPMNAGLPLLSSSVWEWGDTEPHLIISSAMENTFQGEAGKQARNTRLDALSDGKGCSGTVFAPAIPKAVAYAASKEMMDFQHSAGGKVPQVGTQNFVIISDGGIHDNDVSAKVASHVAKIPNGRILPIVVGKDHWSSAMGEMLQQANEIAAQAGKPPPAEMQGVEVESSEVDSLANHMLDTVKRVISESPHINPMPLHAMNDALNKAHDSMQAELQPGGRATGVTFTAHTPPKHQKIIS